MLEPDDLPNGWRLLDQLDKITEDTLERLVIGDLSELAVPDSSGYELQYVSWAQIQHDDGQRATLRIAPTQPGTTGPVAVTAVLIVGASRGDVERQEMLSVPVGAIARAVNARAARLTTNVMDAWNSLQEQLTLPAYDNSDKFYQAVAMRWLAAYYRDNPSPTDRIVELAEHAVSKRTAQRWVTEAKRRGFIPEGLTGTPGRRSAKPAP